MLCTYYKPPFSKNGILDRREIRKNAENLISAFDVRTPSPLTDVGTLSGGNQQKVIVARELSRDNRLIVASQPTRGLDVGSIEYIHGQLLKKRDEGCGILLISSELDEIMELSDRILVMYKGEAIVTVDTEAVSKSEIGLYMAGISQQSVSGSETVAEKSSTGE
jgi:simple sugar transport system ATP-binding protein